MRHLKFIRRIRLIKEAILSPDDGAATAARYSSSPRIALPERLLTGAILGAGFLTGNLSNPLLGSWVVQKRVPVSASCRPLSGARLAPLETAILQDSGSLRLVPRKGIMIDQMLVFCFLSRF